MNNQIIIDQVSLFAVVYITGKFLLTCILIFINRKKIIKLLQDKK